MFSQPDEQLWDHIVEVEHCKIFDNLAAETKNVLANFCGQKPWEQRVNTIQIIMVDNNKLQQATYEKASDIACFLRNEMFMFRVFGIVEKILPHLHEE